MSAEAGPVNSVNWSVIAPSLPSDGRDCQFVGAVHSNPLSLAKYLRFLDEK